MRRKRGAAAFASVCISQRQVEADIQTDGQVLGDGGRTSPTRDECFQRVLRHREKGPHSSQIFPHCRGSRESCSFLCTDERSRLDSPPVVCALPSLSPPPPRKPQRQGNEPVRLHRSRRTVLRPVHRVIGLPRARVVAHFRSPVQMCLLGKRASTRTPVLPHGALWIGTICCQEAPRFLL